MKVYETPILAGILISLFIIYLITIPIAIYQYRKYDGIMVKNNIVLFSFIIYMVTAWFMTILPLPSIEEVVKMPTIQPNFKPFLFIETFLERTNFSLLNRSTWLPALKSSSFYTVAFNVLLTVPFGVYLRKYFNISFKKTLLFGCLLSLFYEITQYTGIYGIYPKAYRYADIDDVIVNTFGAGLGYVITPLISKLLPSIEKNKKEVIRGERAGLLRRAIALFVDFFVIEIIYSIIRLAVYLFLIYILGINSSILKLDYSLNILVYIVFFFVIPILNHGNTFGMNILKIRLVNLNNEIVQNWQIVLRYFILLIIFRGGELFKINNNENIVLIILNIIFPLISMILIIGFGISVIMTVLKKKDLIIYDKISKTKVVIGE